MQLRLRKIGGQIAGIERMMGEDRNCSEVLMQVVSARKALKSLAQLIVHQHLHECIDGALDPKMARKNLQELLVVLERFVE